MIRSLRGRAALRGGLAALLLAWPLATLAAPLKVLASFFILGDMARTIGGGDVVVDTLVGPDGDAHTYEPTPADARKLGQAQLLVVNGLQFEAWLPRLVRASGFAGRTVTASDGVVPRRFDTQAQAAHGDPEHGHDHRHDHGTHADEDDHDGGHGHGHAGDGAHGHGGHDHEGGLDPHAWHDLANGVVYVRNIADALAQADPAHAQDYRERAQAYVARLQALDAKARAAFAALPAERRRVVTSHDAFGYFGAAYGVQFIPVSGVSTEAEPSAAELAALVRQVRKEGVPAVFVENVQSPRLVEQVARETGARVGGTLYSDALAQPGQPADNYVGMFEWNLRQLSDALRP